jgi:hypothetical protein
MLSTVAFAVALVTAAPKPMKPAKPPVLEVRELALMTMATEHMAAINKRVRFGVPKGWTGERHPNGRSVTLAGPEGEGKIVVAAALHPDGLTPYLDELKSSHPAATPSPPMAMELPGVKPERGERATRFVVTGKEVGELVMIEKGDVIVLIVTVVDPTAWPGVEALMQKVYPTVDVVDLPIGSSGGKP